MANFEVIALNQATPQLRAPGAGDGYSMPRPVVASVGSLAADIKVLDLSATWNNAAVTFTGIKLDVTNTASNINSNLLNFLVGGVSKMSLKGSTGSLTLAGSLNCNGILMLSGGIGFPSSNLVSVNPLGLPFIKAYNGVTTLHGFMCSVVSTEPVAVASLISVFAVPVGSRGFVTDATQTLSAGLGAVAVGGGANSVPVYSDGTDWRIG